MIIMYSALWMIKYFTVASDIGHELLLSLCRVPYAVCLAGVERSVCVCVCVSVCMSERLPYHRPQFIGQKRYLFLKFEPTHSHEHQSDAPMISVNIDLWPVFTIRDIQLNDSHTPCA